MNISNSQTNIDLSSETIKQLKKLHVGDSKITLEFRDCENVEDFGDEEEKVVDEGVEKEEKESGHFNSKMRECNETVIYEDNGDCTVFTTSLPMTPVFEGFDDEDNESNFHIRDIEKVGEPQILEALEGDDPVIALVSRSEKSKAYEDFYMNAQKTYKGKLEFEHIRFLLTHKAEHLFEKYKLPESVESFYVTNWGETRIFDTKKKVFQILWMCKKSDTDVAVYEEEEEEVSLVR